ncbi:VWA domain-containing protein [Candidatus Woesearchaeota archaeon]|nr:VWA domain-containing protein [Candidatus Woesearchaeota archaeon]
MMQFENISFLVFIPIVFIALIFIIRHNFVKGVETNKRLRIYVFITKFLIISMLIFALAAPYSVTKRMEDKQSKVNILIDKSNSMQLYEDSSSKLASEIESLSDMGVNTITIGKDLNSPIGNALLNNMIGNDNILLLSDGNSHGGKELSEVLRFASTINSTVNIVELNQKSNDASVSIKGPKYVLSEIQNKFYVDVKVAGEVDYKVIVKLDGKVMEEFSGKTSQVKDLDLALKSGTHKLEAQLIATDYFEENNIFFKTISVLEKPKVLYVSKENSPIEKIFYEIYDLDELNYVPENLDKYFGVIINDIPASELDKKTQLLTNFVLDGNGLMVIGGDNSYDYGNYEESQFQTLLPTKVGLGAIENITDMNIVLVIDISVSSGIETDGYSVVNVEKAQALNVFNQLDPKDYLSVIAFNKEAHVISELDRVENQLDTPQKIMALQNSGGTYLDTALAKADEILSNAAGNKNIVVISDGKTKNVPATNALAIKLREKGVKIHTVGVGPATDEDFLSYLALQGGGTYFQVSAVNKLSLVFGKERSHEKKEWSLDTFNQNHFVTNGIELSSRIYGFNQVVPKASAQQLVVTESGNPIITSWRFGLGRVISMTTDGGNSWAGNLLTKGNSVVVSRAANWAIGDPRRKESTRLSISDGRINENLDFKMYSDKKPNLDGVELIQTDVNLYTGLIRPDSMGFFKIENEEFAINYPREYEDIGMNPELESIVEVTGGEVLNINDIDKIIEELEKDNKKEIEDRNYYRYVILPIIVIIYLIEILIRRKVKN